MNAPAIEPTDIDDLPEAARRYPVIVEETRRYVVWVDAENQDDAVFSFDSDPSDPGRDAMYDFDWTTRAPDSDDWDDIGKESSWGWSGLQADAHVRTWRQAQSDEDWAAKRAACAEAGHPAPEHADFVSADWCITCGQIGSAPGAAAPTVVTVEPAGGVL